VCAPKAGRTLAIAEVLRRAFHRHLGVAPADYRDRFRLTSRDERPSAT
jgi:hypothetical protein